MFNKIFKMQSKSEIQSDRKIFAVMLLFGIVGLIASFVLAVEEFHLLKDPNSVLSCSFNLVLNCAGVMKTWQASVFGFPNMFIGLMGFPMVILIALLGLSQVRFPKWILLGAQVGYLLATLFAYWLFFNSVYAIQILCPWCLLVTFSMTMLLSTITHYNLRENTFGFKPNMNKRVQEFLYKDYDKLAVATWVVVLVSLVFLKFGDALFA
ncbi:vitamin K epoxide reductase family protein [Candidatus Saccharibacteria bacterium]|nr:vitamin K epoxide reductase family protein [Candidatus Saccharibacteria bacterium]